MINRRIVVWFEHAACTISFDRNLDKFVIEDSESGRAYDQRVPDDPMMRVLIDHDLGLPVKLRTETIEHEKRMWAYTAFMMFQLAHEETYNEENRLALWKDISRALQTDRHTHRVHRLFAGTWGPYLENKESLAAWLKDLRTRGEAVPTWKQLIGFRYRVVIFLYVSINTSLRQKKKLRKKHKDIEASVQWGMLPIDVLKNVCMMLVGPLPLPRVPTAEMAALTVV